MKRITVLTKQKYLNVDSFLICRPSNHYYVEGENYTVLLDSSQFFVDNFNLVSKKTIDITDVTAAISYLDLDLCPADFIKYYEGITKKTEGKIDVLVFCKSSYVRVFDFSKDEKTTAIEPKKTVSNQIKMSL